MEAPEAETQKEPDNPLMRKKKTPEELAKEAEEADQDELTSTFSFYCFLKNYIEVLFKKRKRGNKKINLSIYFLNREQESI